MNSLTIKQPKEELNELMVEMFGMIEEIDINEGKYLEFAELFKQMNININRLCQIKTILENNTYYNRFIRNQTTLKRKRLTEDQKRQHSDYHLCSCGRYVNNLHKNVLKHIKTLVHKQGLRNKKYSAKKGKTEIEFEINREVALQSFCIKHICSVDKISIDDLDTDEV